MVEKICVECGAAFMPRHSNQVCCSDECKAARKKRQDDNRYQFRDPKSESAFREERRAKARRRAEFFAARDRAFERAGLPIPKIEERGVVIERRGTCVGGAAFSPTVPISTKSYYYR
ncbi:MAG: hypothetical protein II840_11685 [Kiritimatiellae bacterium]|nr:hypothetical protein [Kiritimatiellia bacterium]